MEFIISLTAFGFAIAAVAHGWLGHVLSYKRPVAIFSGAFVRTGWSLVATSNNTSPLLTERMMEGFGLGALFCTIAALVSEPGSSLLKCTANNSRKTKLCNIDLKYTSETSSTPEPINFESHGKEAFSHGEHPGCLVSIGSPRGLTGLCLLVVERIS
jgi:hypothetical protein